MRKFILIGLFILVLALPATGSTADNDKPRRLITAVDLLKIKGLAPFTPACVINTSQGGLVTAEDLLRTKGLLGTPDKGSKSDPEEEDIWGMEQDFGC